MVVDCMVNVHDVSCNLHVIAIKKIFFKWRLFQGYITMKDGEHAE